MLLLVTLLALAAEPSPPSLSPAEVERLEAKHLKNIRQVTSGFAKAGEGYFRPDGKAIIFQAARPGEDDYQIYTLDLAPGSKPRLVSTGKGKCTCSYYHPDGQSILFASTHLDPALQDGAIPPQSRRHRPILGPSATAGTSTRPWTSSGPTPTARTSSG
jgi:Tol biopolymer transport system component